MPDERLPRYGSEYFDLILGKFEKLLSESLVTGDFSPPFAHFADLMTRRAREIEKAYGMKNIGELEIRRIAGSGMPGGEESAVFLRCYSLFETAFGDWNSGEATIELIAGYVFGAKCGMALFFSSVNSKTPAESSKLENDQTNARSRGGLKKHQNRSAQYAERESRIRALIEDYPEKSFKEIGETYKQRFDADASEKRIARLAGELARRGDER